MTTIKKIAYNPTRYHCKACNRNTGPPFPFYASRKCEMDTHAEVAITAGGDNIFKAKKSLMSKEGMKYIPGSLITANN